MKTITRLVLAGSVLAAVLTATGCAASSPSAPAAAADAVTMTDAWVKAADGDMNADGGMAAAFGILENDSTDEVNIVAVSTSAAAMPELHETVANDAGEMVMRPVKGGFVIPAGASFELAPGGNHIMLMGLTGPLLAGEDVNITLTFSDDSTLSFTAPVKDFAGGNENYESGDGADG